MEIKYKRGYKYQIHEDSIQSTGIVGFRIETDYADMDNEGYLTIKKGYTFDGPSGPTVDTRTFMRPSLVHDVLCGFMREGKLPREKWDEVTGVLYDMCLEDGMNWFRAWYVKKAMSLKLAKVIAMKPRKIYIAP